MRTKLGCSALVVAGLIALWAGVAGAHVTLSPSSLPQGTDDAILTFRVPNESPTASVIGLRIQFPLAHPIVVLNPEAGSGWTVAVHSTTLPKPITTDDGTFKTTVSEIDWSGASIPVGQFGEFNVLAQGLPTGTSLLIFKAVQLYSDGSTVNWIQVPTKAAPDPEHPAPSLVLTPPGKGSPGPAPAGPVASPAAVTTDSQAPSSADNGLAIAALILAGFAVLAAILAIWLGRPRFSPASADPGRPPASSGSPRDGS
jgi:periplasmic copper chaperone A